MNGITISSTTYKLESLQVSTNNGNPSIYLQFDIWQGGVVARAYGITLMGESARNLLVGNQIINAYRALVSELGVTMDIADTVYIEILGVGEAGELASRIEAFRNAYRQSTQAICQLAGFPIVTKMEDTEFLAVRAAADAANLILSGQLRETIFYTLMQLYRLDGDDAWDRI
jgi:hypothetical protein